MDDPYDLVLAMFGLAVAAIMLVAGELYLVTRPDSVETSKPSPVVTSSINQRPLQNRRSFSGYLMQAAERFD
jgi:hypothetical protein